MAKKRLISKKFINKVTGVTKLKRDIAKATGIPTSRAGRQRKVGKMMGCAVYLVAFGLAFMGAIAAAFGQATEPPNITRYLNRCEAKRAQRLRDAKDSVAYETARLKEVIKEMASKKVVQKPNAETLAGQKERVQTAQNELAKYSDPNTIFSPAVDLGEIEVGDIGQMVAGNGIAVLQIVDETNMLVTASGSIFWVDGVSTKGLVDGKAIGLPNPCEATGTKAYTTALGVQKTVMVLEPVDTNEIDKWYKLRVAANAKALPPGPGKSVQDAAAAKLSRAKKLANPDTRRMKLQEVIDLHPGTTAAEEAAKLLAE